MLSFIRNNQKGFLVVVTILICAAFGWFLMRADTSSGRSTTVIKVDGENVREGSFNQIKNQRWIAEVLSLPNYQTVVEQLAPATASAMVKDAENPNIEHGYVATIKIIRNEAERLGIAISEEEIGKTLTNSPAFMTDGKPDRSKIDSFIGSDASNPSDGIMVTLRGEYGQPIQRGPYNLSQRGSNVADLKQVVSDYLLIDKIITVVGGGVQFPKWLAEQNYNLSNQIVIADTITFTTEEMKSKVDVSDDALKAYFDENKDRYLTEPQRVIQYVHFVDNTLAPVPTIEQQATMKSEEIQALADARRKSRNTLGPVADRMLDLLRSGKSFEEAATELKQDLVTTPPFGQSNPPEALAASIRVVQSLTKLNSADAPPQVIADGDSFFVLKLKDFIQSQPKEFDAVKDEVKADLIESRASELAREAANATREKLVAAQIGESTTLEDLKKSLEIEGGTVSTDRKLAPQDANARSMPTDDQSLRYDVLYLQNQEVSDVIVTPTGFTIALVRDRQIERSDEKASQVESTDFNYRQMFDGILFQLWWADRVAAANAH